MFIFVDIFVLILSFMFKKEIKMKSENEPKTSTVNNPNHISHAAFQSEESFSNLLQYNSKWSNALKIQPHLHWNLFTNMILRVCQDHGRLCCLEYWLFSKWLFRPSSGRHIAGSSLMGIDSPSIWETNISSYGNQYLLGKSESHPALCFFPFEPRISFFGLGMAHCTSESDNICSEIPVMSTPWQNHITAVCEDHHFAHGRKERCRVGVCIHRVGEGDQIQIQGSWQNLKPWQGIPTCMYCLCHCFTFNIYNKHTGLVSLSWLQS